MSKIEKQKRDTQIKEDLWGKSEGNRSVGTISHFWFVWNIDLSHLSTEKYLQEVEQVQFRVTRLGMTTTDMTLEKARTMVEQVTSSRLFIIVFDPTG